MTSKGKPSPICPLLMVQMTMRGLLVCSLLQLWIGSGETPPMPKLRLVSPCPSFAARWIKGATRLNPSPKVAPVSERKARGMLNCKAL